MKKLIKNVLLIALFFAPVVAIALLSNNSSDYSHTPTGSCKIVDISTHTLSDNCR